jgi:hypothetical protein
MSAKPEVPVSEDVSKQHFEWTAEQCLEELRRIVMIDPDRVITRNYFRINSKISESTWNRHFGTFAEFKRAAGIVLSRQQHHLEKQIAKHASGDHYEIYNNERMEYGGKYARPSNDRWQTGIVFSDTHDRECDPFFLRVLIKSIDRIQPHFVCAGGDIYDLPEFGRWNVDPREWDAAGRLKFNRNHLWKAIREVYEGQIDVIEGNHEYRVVRQLADASPGLRAVLSDFHGWTVGKLLGLDEFEISYHAKADLRAYTAQNVKREIAQNFKIYANQFVVHHFPEGVALGMPGINGHNHRYEVKSHYNQQFGSFLWVQNGCGHKRDASYTEGAKWVNTFTIVHLDTLKLTTTFETIHITDQAIVGGEFYTRQGNE